ncbi:hypothetical protein [Ligilactobacillus salivarius]|uniref:Uncharacterized protein n=1 Tax=Ligilactobacillus salivarius TaxID=1624 RepID=A0AAW6Q433_9LACO|nr:hypothetical protein [Ligilactobacillus salivarius]MDF4186144.1 hypothetical protein [Ligilactobacillus salivarius]
MKNFKITFTGICIVLLIMIIINFGMDWWIFDKLGNGSDDGWLGFWGGFLGAIFAVVGVWWQTNKTIKNEKELMFSQKRPYIILQELSADKVDEVYGISNCDLKDKFQILVIKNLSNQPFFSVKIVLNDQGSPVIIDRIDKNKDIGILVNSVDVNKLQEAERNLKESVAVKDKGNLYEPKQLYDDSVKEIKEIFDKYNQDFEGLGLSKDASKVDDDRFRKVYTSKYSEGILDESIVNITKEIKTEKVTIYFTTTIREKVKLVFKKEDKKYRYQKNETKLENKGSIITEEEYDTSDMYESYKLK